MQKRHLLILLAIAVVAVIVFLLLRTPPTEWHSAARLGEFVESRGVVGALIFLTVALFATSVGLPRQFFAFAAGFSYGVPVGVLLSSTGAIAGCALTFVVSKRILAERVRNRYPSMVSSLNRLLVKDAALKIFVLRIQPLGTNLITNLCAGVSDIRPATFFLSSWVGYLPQMLVFALLGAGVRIKSDVHLMLSLFLLAVSLSIGFWLYKRHIESGEPH